jgi:hypothetical protein
MRQSAASMAVFLFAFSAFAADHRAPWEWTLNERLALRHNPSAAAERVRAEQQSGRTSRFATNATPMTADLADFISGSAHPELLLPWEIFDHMMAMAYSDDSDIRSTFREATSKAAEVSLPADFWSRLEPISAAYLSDVRQLHELHRRNVRTTAVSPRIAAETVALEHLKCFDRAAAIAAARNDFGETFDRLLYQVIARGMFIAVGKGGVIPEEREREIERGCQ